MGWLAAVLGLASALTSRDAEACGGLFCSLATPVNQAAERIVFAHDESAGRVTAVIEILYQGPAEQFAWILPVSGTPDVSVSTNALLNRLQQATNPLYQLQRTWSEGDCNPLASDADDSGGNSIDLDAAPSEGGSVSVLASGNAGPYDYEVISVAQAAGADPAQEAIEWLTDNGYDTGTTGPDLLRPYLMNGMILLAVRLSKDAAVGSIRPIKLAYDSDEPMIPIRPTAVAANADMGILVWVLGSARAVPFNYKSLELYEALIDWFNPQQSYNDVVIAAANETGDGQGFVTEQARLTNDPQLGSIVDQLYVEQSTILDYRRNADALNDAELIIDVVSRFSVSGDFSFTGPFGAAAASGQVSLDGVVDVIATHVRLPEGVSMDDFVASPGCYFDDFQAPANFYCDGRPAPEEPIFLANFNRDTFLTDVEELIIQPIEQTVQLFADLPYMTRFYTTLSADEMTVDPAFAINSDLPDVDNQHFLELEYEGCAGDVSGPWEASVGGHIVRGEGNTWPLTLADRPDDMPVNLRVLQLGVSGSGEVYENNDEIIGDLLSTEFGQPGDGPDDPNMIPSMNPPRGDDPMNPRGGVRSSGGCSIPAVPRSAPLSPAVIGLLGLAALGALRARRAQARR
jgi:hypothetical protein